MSMTMNCNHYFEEISLIERALVYRVHRFMHDVQDRDLINAAKIIVQDEENHYIYSRLMLESILFKDAAEKRSYERKHIFGDVRFVSRQSGTETKARCVDISENGLGFESDTPLEVSEKVEAWVSSYDGKTSRNLKGQVVWVKKVHLELFTGNTLHFYMGGIAAS